MFMESANGQSDVTMGTLARIRFTIGEINLYCTVQVVQEAPFECLISRPLTALAQTVSWEFLDGTAHLTLTDPNTGATVTVPTQARETPAKCRHRGGLSEEDLQ